MSPKILLPIGILSGWSHVVLTPIVTGPCITLHYISQVMLLHLWFLIHMSHIFRLGLLECLRHWILVTILLPSYVSMTIYSAGCWSINCTSILCTLVISSIWMEVSYSILYHVVQLSIHTTLVVLQVQVLYCSFKDISLSSSSCLLVSSWSY
jgi:hypothetical protein